MGKSPLILAALAKDAVPALDFVQVVPLQQRGDGYFDSACLTGTNGSHYVVKMARNQEAGLMLDTELMVLRSLAAFRGRLPFEITKLLGETKDAFGKRALLFSFVYGNHTDIDRMGGDDPIATSLADALAAIHSLPLGTVEDAGLPQYSPAEIVRGRVAELDRAAQTGKVPAVLLNRWEQALEDINLWRFNPTVVHGHVDGENFLSLNGNISGVLYWNDMHIGDPAEDFSWIVGYGGEDFAYSSLLEYGRLRGTDDNLRARAQLYSEMQVARYLLDSIARNDQDNIDHAVGIFQTYVADIESDLMPAIGPKPLAAPAPVAAPVSTFAAPVSDVVAFEAAEFVDVAQSVVADDLFLNPATEFLATEEAPEVFLPMPVVDPAEVEPESVNIFKSVFDESYNHKALFGETGPIDLAEQSAEVDSALDDATKPIDLPDQAIEADSTEVETAEDQAASKGELF